MKIDECPREPELLDSIQAMQWPELADPELRAHVTDCGACAELATVANAFFRDYDEALHETAIPPAGAVWFRAQRRLRADAIRKATRTLYAVQAFSLAAAVVLVIVLFGTTFAFSPDWSAIAEPFARMKSLLSAPASLHWSLPIIMIFAGTAALAPVALYLAVDRD
jgi:predicted anti-sigma-YlaC factor YlaD